MTSFYCNCLIWALWQKLLYGGEIDWRWSHYAPVYHFLWSPDSARWYGFQPLYPRKGWIVFLCMWVFLGIVIREEVTRT